MLLIISVNVLFGLVSAFERQAFYRSFPEDEAQKSRLLDVLDSKSCEITRNTKINDGVDFICERDSVKKPLSDLRVRTDVLIDHLPSFVESQRRTEETIRSFQNLNRQFPDPTPDFQTFPSFVDVENYLRQLNTSNRQFISLETKGVTHEGRPLYMLRIGTRMEKIERKSVFIDAGIHAREWAAVSSGLYTIKKLVDLFDSAEGSSDPRLSVNWIIMPLLNPDGYEYTRSTNRMWRKNRSPPPVGSKCFGTDLNRNWLTTGFGIGASTNPCSNTYKGSEADSEPEVKAAKQVLFERREEIKQYMGLHSYGSYILTSWGYTAVPPKDNERLISIANRAKDNIHAVNGRTYTVGAAGAIFYVAGGASDDYAKEIGIPTSMTVELPGDRGVGFLLPSSEIIKVGEEVWSALRSIAEVIEEEDKS